MRKVLIQRNDLRSCKITRCMEKHWIWPRCICPVKFYLDATNINWHQYGRQTPVQCWTACVILPLVNICSETASNTSNVLRFNENDSKTRPAPVVESLGTAKLLSCNHLARWFTIATMAWEKKYNSYRLVVRWWFTGSLRERNDGCCDAWQQSWVSWLHSLASGFLLLAGPLQLPPFWIRPTVAKILKRWARRGLTLHPRQGHWK